jgi:hypothetical protein
MLGYCDRWLLLVAPISANSSRCGFLRLHCSDAVVKLARCCEQGVPAACDRSEPALCCACCDGGWEPEKGAACDAPVNVGQHPGTALVASPAAL